MAITLKQKRVSYELQGSFNGFDLNYRFEEIDGTTQSSMYGEAKTAEGRAICSLNTSDGENFYGNVNMNATDETAGILEQIKADLQAIKADPQSFINA